MASITVAGEGLVLQGRCVQGLQRLRTAAVEVGRQDGEGCSVPFREASTLAVDHEVPMEASGKTEKNVMTLISLPKRTIED